MAAPSYTTDLATLDLAEANTNWAEPTATGWTLGAAPGTADVENFIQSNNSVPKAFNATGVGGLMLNFGSGVTIPTDGVFTGWMYWASPQTLDTEANGGIRMMMGSSLSAFYGWKLGGKDTYAYGGWVNWAVDPTVTVDYTLGSPTATKQYFGWAVNNTNSITKGSPMVTDAFRYGRAEARINGGETANYATFSGYAATNDTASNRWGLIQSVPGGYLWKGLMTLGYTSAVDFRDSNTQVLVDNTKKVGANFNLIQIRQASSRVDWTNIAFVSLCTVSRGRFEVVDNADVNIDSCQFTSMDTFVLLSGTDILNSTFRNCNTITAPGSNLSGTSVLTPIVTADTSAVIWNVATDTDGKLDNMTFSKGTNAHHAIELGTSSPVAVTLRGITFTGFDAANAANGSVIHVKRTTGTVDISTVGCTGTVSYKTAGATVNIIADPVSATVNAKNVAGSNIQNARVLLKAAAGGPFPSDVTVTITNSGTTATVSHTTHAMATNDKVMIKGASLQANNGIYSITKINDNSYSYTMGSSPGSNPTGTIKATYVVLSGLTDSSGNITMSRVFSADQPVSGWARKSSASPYYKESLLGGSVDSVTGYSANALLVADE